MITFGSLFAGIGGFDLGFERAGMVCKWQVEIDDYANEILKKHWPNVHRERDITQVGSHNLEAVDVICGGFPCQDISSAGKRIGISGDRSGLFFEAVRVVAEMRPRILVLENVSALLDRDLGAVLIALAEIGYDAEWHCFSASAFDAYHIRDRIFVLAYSDCDGQPPVIAASGVASTRSREAKAKWRGIKPKLKRGASGRVWPMPPSHILGMANGFSKGVDEHRLRCLGNAVVPQVAEYVGRAVVEALQKEESK